MIMPFFKRPKYSTVRAAKKDIPAGLWVKCKGCKESTFKSNIDENKQICPKCGFHYPMTAEQRISLLTDEKSFKEIDVALTSFDAINFFEDNTYEEKLEGYKKKTGGNEAVVCGTARLDGAAFALGVMDFRFMGASMGSVVGEKITRLAEDALKERLPLVLVCASGGARMQEGILSLMQMAKTSGALALLDDAGIPFVSVLTHPTTGGVTASYASLGDVVIAEPGALIGFAGPRVIQQTTKSDLPKGFQTAEFLMEHGFIDRVVHRHSMRSELSQILDYFSGASGLRKQA